MGFRCGIIGLPNVGKSTLFNALTDSAAAAAENYPFCTIEPNIGRVPVPDPRVAKLAEISGSAAAIETRLTFVDIAGLVAGASRGEGLGNKFLGNIREVDAIIHVLRCFSDPDVTHVAASPNPAADAETVETELMLADMESVEARIEKNIKRARGGDKEAKAKVELLEAARAYLAEGKPVSALMAADPERAAAIRGLQLLTGKPVLYVANVDESALPAGNAASDAVREMAAEKGQQATVICAAAEAEAVALDNREERREYLASLGLEETGLAKVIRKGLDMLGLITFFTTGPKETKAWTIPRGTNARAAAGQIHTDFARGFIRAETISYDDFIAHGGEQGARDAGRMRLEGRDYIVQDGDILLFRFAT